VTGSCLEVDGGLGLAGVGNGWRPSRVPSPSCTPSPCRGPVGTPPPQRAPPDRPRSVRHPCSFLL